MAERIYEEYIMEEPCDVMSERECSHEGVPRVLSGSREPDVLHSHSFLDFGKGFYVTTLREQALNYSRRFVSCEEVR